MPALGHDIIKKFDALSTDSRSVCKQIAEGKSDAEVLTPGHKKVSQVQATVRIACSEFGFNTGMYMTDRQNLGDLYKAYIAEMGARRKPASDGKDRGNSRAAPGPAPTDGSPSRPGAGDGNDKGSGAAPPGPAHDKDANKPNDAAAAASQGGDTDMTAMTKGIAAKLADGPRRHRDVARCIAKGMSNARIKKTLKLQDDTVAGVYAAGLWRHLGLTKKSDKENRVNLLKAAVKLLPKESELSGKKAKEAGANKSRKPKKANARASAFSDLDDDIEHIKAHAEALGGGDMADVLNRVADGYLSELVRLRGIEQAAQKALETMKESTTVMEEALAAKD
ncbi:hypothetical protein A3A40_00150 [Candidatus Kaiserbacteria bacterium RIFCSPLOWO2_01_FULL_54_20]|uniref:Uncharacterized protein n=1 Tax=Candidatus Kaiserbacteria bacterium RIFCSPLOWO2_01_FULL_54_20 TaxID=1798513 RepID=A0A1F6EKJ6_9BACT|nr:MAG: hypothetical protein A3A40_00150 [Candidatus Kaiserbacteria bacterium RIFCSPLOWO2_01_FULL_54_20]